MQHSYRQTLTTCTLLLLCMAITQRGVQAQNPQPLHTTPAHPRVVTSCYARLPLAFEPNLGQTDRSVRFLTHGRDYTLFLTRNEAVFALRKPQPASRRRAEPIKTAVSKPSAPLSVLRMKLVGANPNAHVVGSDQLPGRVNYFIGNDPRRWRTDVPTCAQVRYQGVYPGVDLVYYGNQRQLEYDFVIAPGADPKAVRLRFDGAWGLRIDRSGDLVVRNRAGFVRWHRPVVYQAAGGRRIPVEGRFVLHGAHQVGFQVARYDAHRPLVIDPTLAYSTYLGGSGVDRGYGIAVDSYGSAYITGTTTSANFPTTSGAFQGTSAGTQNIFVTKVNAAGTALAYSTYLGGQGPDYSAGIAVDETGSAYITGTTESTNFPTTPGGFQTGRPGDQYSAFVTKLDATGAFLLYSTYLGGSISDAAAGIAVDSSGSAIITGSTSSSDFPVTPGAYKTVHSAAYSDAFVAKLAPSGESLVYATFLSGNPTGSTQTSQGNGVAVDAADNAYVVGDTLDPTFPTTTQAYQRNYRGIFVTKLNAAGSKLDYSTFLGGTTGTDQGYGIAVDGSDNAYVTGDAGSTDFPTTSGAFQTTLHGNYNAFVTKLNSSGSKLTYSTLLGGDDGDTGFGIAVDTFGDAYVAGGTSSSNFPLTPAAVQSTYQGNGDAFVTRLNPNGTALVYSTFLGGDGADGAAAIAVDGNQNAYVTGYTASTNFPTTPGWVSQLGGIENAFITEVAGPYYLQSISVSPSTVAGSLNAMGTVTLSAPASAPTTIALNTDNPAATVPSTVTVPQGSASATFTISTTAVSSVKTGGVTGTLAGSSVVTGLTVRPIELSSGTLTPNPVVGGKTVQVTLTLEAKAAPGSITVTLFSSNPSVVYRSSATVTVPAGSQSVTFTASTSPVTTTQQVTVGATANGNTISTVLTVLPNGIASLTLSPNPVVGGNRVTGTVTLVNPAPSGGVTVTVSSSDPAIALPAVSTVNVPAGATTATFQINTAAILANTSAVITASAEGTTQSVTLSINL